MPGTCSRTPINRRLRTLRQFCNTFISKQSFPVLHCFCLLYSTLPSLDKVNAVSITTMGQLYSRARAMLHSVKTETHSHSLNQSNTMQHQSTVPKSPLLASHGPHMPSERRTALGLATSVTKRSEPDELPPSIDHRCGSGTIAETDQSPVNFNHYWNNQYEVSPIIISDISHQLYTHYLIQGPNLWTSP